MLTVPLRAYGVDESGQEFTCPARTVSVNRHGAHIQLDRPLKVGARIRLRNLAHPAEAEFRVVVFLGASEGGMAEWGVEAMDAEFNFWGIHFPNPSKSTAETSALAECQQCHSVALLKVSEVEAGVLESGARVPSICQKCRAETAWGSAERALPQVSAVAPHPVPAPPKAGERRHARHYVQKPLTIRDASGAVEKTRTENVSRSGLCCTSERTYEAGQTVTLSWPHDSAGAIYEVQARVTRRHDLGGSNRKIYGLDFESPPLLRSAPVVTSARPAWQFIALVSAAAALAGAAVFSLAAHFEPSSPERLPAIELAIALSLLYLASRTRTKRARMILESQGSRRKTEVGLTLALIVTVLGAGAAGLLKQSRRVHEQEILADLSISRSIEQRLDVQESRNPVSAGDYQDDCETLKLLARLWKGPLNRLSSGLLSLTATNDGDKSISAPLQRLRKMVDIDQEKLRIIFAQAALPKDASRIPQSQQLEFWQSSFGPLQTKYEQLNRLRDAAVRSITGARQP